MGKRNRKQAYYNKEYSRLLAQAKKTYNEMSLGGIFGEDLPSFEKILNYAGTSSGLKKPTKESLKALRKLKTESDILWGIEHTLNKKSPNYKSNLERLEQLKEVKENLDKSLVVAKKGYNKENKGYSKQEKETKQFNTFQPIEVLLSQLRYYHNHCTEKQYKARGRKNKKYKNSDEMHYDWARSCIERLIEEINDILNSGDNRKIEELSLGCAKFFIAYPGGVELWMFYYPEDGGEIRKYIFDGLNGALGIEDNNPQNPNDPNITPSEDLAPQIMKDAWFITDDFF